MKIPVWTWLRQSRSDPPTSSIADHPERLSIYRAALRQFEELMMAAKAAGYASRPLPLFYALSQASRAVIAAKGGEQPRLHGLSFPSPVGQSVLQARVKPQEAGSFVTLAAGVGSPRLLEEVEVGAMINSLPEFSDAVYPQLEEWPHALFVQPDRDSEHAWMLAKDRRMVVGIVIDPFPSSPEEARAILSRYPALDRVSWEIQMRQVPGLQQVRTPRGPGVWTLLQLSEQLGIDQVAPEYRWHDSRWIRPAIAGSPPPDALLTWWALLFGLSNLARYYPVEWTKAIDVDASRHAVVLERVMTEALDAVPQLVLGALANQQILHLD